MRCSLVCSFMLFMLIAHSIPAFAQDRCEVVDQYVAEAAGGFAALRGKQFDDNGSPAFEVKKYMAGASSCAIKEGTYDSNWQLVCKFLFVTEQDRNTNISLIRSGIEQCGKLPNLGLYSVRTKGYKGIRDVDILVNRVGKFDAAVIFEHKTDHQIVSGR